MSQPPYPYNRIFDFESFSIVNPTTQQPGVQIEGELDNVKRTLDSVISRLSEIQRDDGYIRDSALDQSTAIPQFYDRLVLLFGPAFALKAPIASPVFTGVVTIPANAVIVGFAKLESPAFTGVPTAPTPATLSDSQQVANAAFVTAADAAIKQFVIDNYLKLDGDQMNDDSVIFWTKETPSQWAPYALGNEKDIAVNSISKDGINLTSTKFVLSKDGDTGENLDPANPPHAGEYQEMEWFNNIRNTKIEPGHIEITNKVNPISHAFPSSIDTLGKITIWSGRSVDGSAYPQFFDKPSLPYIHIEDMYHIYGPNGMWMTSNGLQFPDGSNQDTRGLSGQEVYDIARYEANLAVDNLVAGAPAALDTLKEIADALGNDANLAGTLANSIATKADIVHSHVTSDIIGLDAAINSGKITDYDNFKVYVAGDVVLASNRIYRFNATVGAAGYGPITHPSYWTEQSAAPSLSGYATESFVLSQGYTTGAGYVLNSSWQMNAINASNYINLSVPATSGPQSIEIYDGWVGSNVVIGFEIQSPADGNNYNGYGVSFDNSQYAGYISVVGNSVTIGINGYMNMQDACNSLSNGINGWKLLASGSPYVSADVLTGFGRTVYSVVQGAEGKSFVIKDGIVPVMSSAVKNAFNVNNGVYATDGYGQLIVIPQNTFPTNENYLFEINRRVLKSGDTFTGKMNMASLAGLETPSLNLGVAINATAINAVSGDIFITNAAVPRLTYRSGTSNYSVVNQNSTNTFSSTQIIDCTSNTAPALRITQKGMQPVLVVEDSINPDATALVVDTNGNVGIGVATGYSATQKVEVVGNVKADGFVNGSGPVFTVKSVSAHANGADTHDIYMSVNGSTYRIPAIFVSTP